MAIEKTLEKILEQLELLNGKIPAAGGVETPAPPAAETNKKKGKEDPAPASGPTPTTAPVISREALGEKLKALAMVNMDAARAILTKFKCVKLADAAESDYAAILKDVEAASAAVATESIL